MYDVLNTVENRTRLPSNLGHTLQHLLPHHTMWELSLLVGLDLVWGEEKRDSLIKESVNVAFFREV